MIGTLAALALSLHTCYTPPRLYVGRDGRRTMERDWYMAQTCDAGDEALTVAVTPRLSGWTVTVTRDADGSTERSYKLPVQARIADAWRWAIEEVAP